MPHLIGFKVFTKDIAAVNLMKTRCIINRPFYVGFAVLELSKLHMYKFHYDFVKRQWPGKQSQLLFTDTDSLMYEIHTTNLYDTIWEHRDMFDLSDYPKEFYHSDENNKVIGKFKDECNGKPMLEFVGLRPKMYSFTVLRELNPSPEQDGTSVSEKARAKGIQRAALQRLRHDDYLRQLRTPVENHLTNRRIGAKLHKVYTFEFPKRGLCAFDDKRYILDDGETTYAYGHYRMRDDVPLVATTRPDRRTIRTFRQAAAENQLGEHGDGMREIVDSSGGCGIDPERATGMLRRQRLEKQFPEGVAPKDMCDLLPYVI